MREFRRKSLKRLGIRTFRGLNGFLGRQSLVGDPPVFDRRSFPCTGPLEARWRGIRDECRRVLDARDRLPLLRTLSRDNQRIAAGDDWKVFVFHGFGYRSKLNCAACPETAAVLDAIPGLENAWFSVLAPHARIPAHRGISKGLVRCHLALIVPRERERCSLRIAGREVFWDEGKCLVFDDMNEHSVRNDTDEERAVLLLDVHRPLRAAGSLVSRGLLGAMRRTAYVREAYRAQVAWEREFYSSR